MGFAARNSMTTQTVDPILKWPGGKRWLVPILSNLLAVELKSVYYEPFLGGAAVYLALLPQHAVLSDVNEQLIEFYRTCVQDPTGVAKAARAHRCDAESYYRVRSSKPRTSTKIAGRFLYLNKSCWGGVFRLNQSGEFNVPFGNSGRAICTLESLQRFSRQLSKAELRSCDFGQILDAATAGDVVFCDPPYTAKGQFNGFVRYNETLFSWQDQVRLSRASKSAKKRGAFVVVCGSYHREVLSLYQNWWTLEVNRVSRVARSPQSRKVVSECLIFSRKPKKSIDSIQRISPQLIASIPQHD
jgi:DNA adenine methylase